ncbi:MAG: hypothetical protein ACFFB0_13315 [Promethearchaeota archaeon]
MTILLLILPMFFIFNNIPSVEGNKEEIYDTVDDIYRFENYKVKDQGDFKDDIDITTIKLDDQFAKISFAAKLMSAEMTCTIYFFSHYDPNNISYEYGIFYANYSSFSQNENLKVFFVKFAEGSQTKQFWNGIDWSWNISQGESIGSISNNTINGTIPIQAWQIPNNVTFYAISTSGDPSTDKYVYADVAPNEYSPYKLPSNKVLGYELFILFSSIICISFIIVWYSMEKKKSI